MGQLGAMGQLGVILQKEPQLSAGERHQLGDYAQHLLGLLQVEG